MIFIYTELPDNTRPHHFALEFCHDEAEAAHLAADFKSSIFFFADLCVIEPDEDKLTPREEFESEFNFITDEQWQWLKEFVKRNPII